MKQIENLDQHPENLDSGKPAPWKACILEIIEYIWD